MLLVALAGCSGLSGMQGPTATPDATAPETDGPGGDGAPSFPAGADREGIENASALLDAHGAALNGTAHRASLTSERNGPNAGRTETVVATDGRRTLSRTATDGRIGTVWRTERGRISRRVADGETTYSYAGGDAAFGSAAESVGRLTQAMMLGLYLHIGEFAYRGATTRDGRTLLYYEATDVNESALSNASAAPTALDVDLYVSSDGVIRRLNATAYDRVDGRNATSEFSYRVRKVGEVNVSEPVWVDANVPQVTLTRGDDGRTVTVRHVGGPALPAGASITGDDLTGYGTLDAALKPGGTATVAVADGRPVIARDGAPAVDGARLDGRVRLFATGGGATVRYALPPLDG